MGYQRGDNRFGGGDDRWREQNRGGYESRDRGDRQGHEGGGFFERARSWFSDDDDDRGGNRGGRDYQRDRDHGPAERMTGWGGEESGGGWGNQRSGGGGWGNERSGGGGRGGDGGRENYGRRGYGAEGQSYGAQGRGGRSYGTQAYGNQGSRDRDYGREQGGGYSGGSMSGSGGGGADTWGGSGFGGLDDNGRRFDRVDAGSTGTQGAHPMSAPVDGGYGGYGTSSGGFGSSARSAAIMAQAQGGGAQHHDYSKVLGDRPQQQQQGRGGGMHDHHYSEWRERQIGQLDRDYDEYRREHQSKFEQEFHGWREKRQGQRQSIRKAAPQMEVIGSDGQHIGTVDKVAGDRIILTKNDENAGGHHHSIPCSWIESVDERVTVNKSAQEAMNAWRDEEHNRALFERESQGSEGPHILNRSFSGTYDEGQR